jgi:hypothetical protein
MRQIIQPWEKKSFDKSPKYCMRALQTHYTKNN